MPGNPFTDPNWAADVTSQVDRAVGKVREFATDRIVFAVRAIVFGLLIAIVAVGVAVLGVIIATRLAQALLDIVTDRDSAVWISYLLMSLLLFVVGTLAMKRRQPTPEESK
jgi:H+/Cl- antiporter ClcA